MSSTVSFNPWSFPSLGFAELVDPRLTWPVAGSFVLHVVVACVAVMSERLLPAVEVPEVSYHVALVTLPAHRSPPVTTSRAAAPRVLAPLPERRSPPVVPPDPVVQKPETVVRATALPGPSEPSVSHAATPLKVPQLAAVEPVFQKQETPVHRATKASPTAESLTRMIDSVQIPRIKKTRQANPVSASAPQSPEPVSHTTENTVRERSPRASIVVPPPPSLASVSVGQEPIPLQRPLPVPTPKSERVRHEHAIADLAIPELPAPVSRQPVFIPAVNETQAAPTTLQVEGSSPGEATYWEDVQSRIHQKWIVPKIYDRPLQVVLAFRVERSGRVNRLTIERSSGNDAYDLLARRVVTSASPFPPLPPTITEDYRDIHFTFTLQQN